MANQTRRFWLLPLGCAALAGGLLCGALLLVSSRYTLPEKPHQTADITSAAPTKLSRAALRYTPPKAQKPKSDFVYTCHIDMDQVQKAAKENAGVIGWIYIPDTLVDYPVLQTTDNVYYVEHDEYGRVSHSGAIFADTYCNPDRSDNSLIYGHNMGNGSMFHHVKNYKDQAWGEEHPYFELATLEHRYLYRVISCNVLCGEAGAEFPYWEKRFINMSEDEWDYYYDNIRSSSLCWYDTGNESPKDGETHYLVLQTCNSGAADGIRCCVFAERVGDVRNMTEYCEKTGIREPRLAKLLVAPA
jgi:SrtB family sortase